MSALLVIVGGCTLGTLPTSTVSTADASAPAPQGLNIAGIVADTRWVPSGEEAYALEVTITTHIRVSERYCEGPDECLRQLDFLIKSSALLDYRSAVTSDSSSELAAENQVDSESSVAQVLTFEGVEPGDHCLAVFSQVLRVEEGRISEREGMLGTYQRLSLPKGPTDPSPHCSTDGLVLVEGTFVEFDEGGCGGLPIANTTGSDGQRLPDDEMLVLVPSCPQDLVSVIFWDGEILPGTVRLLSGQAESGFYEYSMPRPQGRWRVASIPVERYRGTIPDDSYYWDVVFSPPYEF